MICAQAVIHFRPQESYEKYLKLLVSAMVLIQMFLPIGRILFWGDSEGLAAKSAAFLEGLEEEMAAAENRAYEADALLEQMTLEEVRQRVEEAQSIRQDQNPRANHAAARRYSYHRRHPSRAPVKIFLSARKTGDLAEPELSARRTGDLVEPELSARRTGDLAEPEPSARKTGDLAEPGLSVRKTGNLTKSGLSVRKTGDLAEPEPSARKTGELMKLELSALKTGNLAEPEPSVRKTGNLTKSEPPAQVPVTRQQTGWCR